MLDLGIYGGKLMTLPRVQCVALITDDDDFFFVLFFNIITSSDFSFSDFEIFSNSSNSMYNLHFKRRGDGKEKLFIFTII